MTHKKLINILLIIIVCLTITLLGIILPNKYTNNDKIYNGIYQCYTDNISATCFAISPYYFISCAHNFVDNNCNIIYAKNDYDCTILTIVFQDLEKDLVLLKSNNKVSKYISLDNQTNENVKFVYTYGNYMGDELIQHKLSVTNFDKNILLDTETKKANIKILKGNIESGFSGAPIITDKNNVVGIISCINNNNDDIYAISITEIKQFVENYKCNT